MKTSHDQQRLTREGLRELAQGSHYIRTKTMATDDKTKGSMVKKMPGSLDMEPC
jgi:hypothetical protein